MNNHRWHEPREVSEDVLNSSSDRKPVPLHPQRAPKEPEKSEKDSGKDTNDTDKSAPPTPESLKEKSAGTTTRYQPVIRSPEEAFIPTAEEYEEVFSDEWDEDSESGIIEGPSEPLRLTRALKFHEFRALPQLAQPTHVAPVSWAVEDISKGLIE